MGRSPYREFWLERAATLEVTAALLEDAAETLKAAADANERALAVLENARRTLAGAKALRERVTSDAMLVGVGYDQATPGLQNGLVSSTTPSPLPSPSTQ